MLEFDYGDAPMERYPTLLEHNGALHIYNPRVHLGSAIDPETDGQPDHTCTGDDHHGLNDDDGVIFIPPAVPGQPPEAMITASCDGFLNAWMDFNNNGNWTDPGEHIFVDEPLQKGQSTLGIPVPEEFVTSEIFSRFRFSTVPGLDFVGIAIDGEVEDYYITLVVTDVKQGSAKTPSRYALYQNYPNPFNPSTELSFDLPNECEVELVIYDLIGERVCDLLNDHMQAGQHRVRWNGRNNAGNLVPTGIYLVHMRAGEFTATRKIILLK
ncbi:T9SS type A sorting domain-containing protein [candidate division KSB1 bacterium]|nr:T9SS type A sorting domain-containing protein [candidate division KSB1 bacterium]